MNSPDATSAAPPSPAAPGKLPATVRWFGVASLMTDAAGEMIYPLLPLFLTSVLGGTAAFAGVIEGFAESTAALLKLFSGRVSDKLERRKPLTFFGYSLTSIVRPLIALAPAPWAVLFLRVGDRIGKGLRSSPRDAMVADVTPKELRGRAYGYHQAMDNAGAVLGPLIGFALMRGLHLPLRWTFAWAAVPGLIAIIAVGAVREAPRAGPGKSKPPIDLRGYGQLYRYLIVLGVFTLGNASDIFLLLRAAEVLHPGQHLGSVALADPQLLLLWSMHQLVKALLSERGGILSDRYGRKPIIAAGWAAYALTYLAFGFATQAWQMWLLFAGYGLYYSLVEGAEKAMIADLTPESKRGAGFGWYNAVIGAFSLPSSVLFGFLLDRSALLAFGAAAGFAALACLLLFLWVPSPPAERP